MTKQYLVTHSLQYVINEELYTWVEADSEEEAWAKATEECATYSLAEMLDTFHPGPQEIFPDNIERLAIEEEIEDE